MQLNLLHLDDALKHQPLFMEQCAHLNARETEATESASHVRLWGKDAALESLQKQIQSSLRRDSSDTVVTFMGSGDFHHVSALLIGMLAENQDEKITIIHFDNHPDWVHFSGGMHCGSWVNRALALPQVEKIITIGVCSQDLKWPQFKRANLHAWENGKITLLPWHTASKRFSQDNIEHTAVETLLKSLASLIPTRNIYITIDKDVLSHADAITNWDQGHMPLAYLLTILRHLLAHHHAIGIDITGDYSEARYSGSPLKKLESLIDQPRQRTLKQKAANTNQTSNLTLLYCIREAI